MLDELVVEELEADFVACFDGVGLGAAGLGAFVAAHVVRVYDIRGEGWVVGVAVFASICVPLYLLALGFVSGDGLWYLLATHGLAVYYQPIKDVVSFDD